MSQIDLDVSLQQAVVPPRGILIPPVVSLKHIIKICCAAVKKDLPFSKAEITLRIVGDSESAHLNKHYRNKNYPTNILSFAYPEDKVTKTPFTGDLVICLPKVLAEANEQGKEFRDHFTHLVVHGVLHLLGYDHEVDADREEMEALEDQILHQLLD